LPCRKYAKPYERYWLPANETEAEAPDAAAHHKHHGTKHHKHHGTKRQHSQAQQPQQPQAPAGGYEQYYKQYLPSSTVNAAESPAASSAATATPTSLSNVPAAAEYMSEYMDSSRAYSAGPEIAESQQLSSDMESPYSSYMERSATYAQQRPAHSSVEMTPPLAPFADAYCMLLLRIVFRLATCPVSSLINP
jgi:hypothetical protein